MMMINNEVLTMESELVDAGGGCMVLVQPIYNKQLKQTFYYLAEFETVSLFTTNPLEFETDDYESMMISTYRWEDINLRTGEGCSAADLPLFDYIYHQLIIEMCELRKNRQHIDIDRLPQALYSTLAYDYINWLIENERLVETDGKQVYIDSCYKSEVKEDQFITDDAKEARRMLDYINHCLETDSMNKDVTITIGNQTLHGYFCPPLIQGIESTINDFLEYLDE